MKPLLLILIAVIVVLLFSLNPTFSLSQDANIQEYLIKTSPKHSKQGLYFQPNGPFTVMLFNEDAAGIYLGVILYKAGSGDIWSLDNRFWQEKNGRLM